MPALDFLHGQGGLPADAVGHAGNASCIALDGLQILPLTHSQKRSQCLPDVFLIRRKLNQQQLDNAQQLNTFAPPGSLIEAIKKKSGDLVSLPSVTERTTRDLK